MREVDKDIKEKNFRPVYLLYGSENYLKNSYRDLIKKEILGDDTMNFALIEGEKFDLGTFIDQAGTMPFFAEKRVVVVNRCGLFAKSADDLADYIPNIPDTACVIFVEDEVKKNTRTFKAVEKCGCAQELDAIIGNKELYRWLSPRMKVNDRTLQIKQSAWEAFVARGDKDMYHMINEMDKLVAYCADKEFIDLADVEMICTGYIEDKIFDMLDAAAMRDKTKTMRLYRDLLLLKEPAAKILILLQRQIRILYMVKQMSLAHLSDDDIAKKAGVARYFVSKYRRLSGGFDEKRLKQLLNYAVDAEEDFKTGKLDEQMALEILLNNFGETL